MANKFIVPTFANNIDDNADKKIMQNQINEIVDAIKNLDTEKVIYLTDYDGTYDAKNVDNFFEKYENSKETVKILVDSLNVEVIKAEQEKDNNKNKYRVLLNIEMINIEKLFTKIIPAVTFDLIISSFKKDTNLNNGIIDIILKNIKKQIDKNNIQNINFKYEVYFVYDKIKNKYVLETEELLNNIYEKLSPLFKTAGIEL